MFGPRPVHLFACLILLAVAGCAGASVQETQTSAGAAVWRPKMVLVNDFVLSSDAVVDRDFAARLESKLDNYPLTNDVIESMAAKRVNDEMVATIIVIVGAAGLNARSRGQEDLTPKNGALVISGRLHAVDQGNRRQRNPVRFDAGSSVVADVTMSQVSDGTEKQLFAFTAQAQSGRQSGAAIAGLNAPALSAAISGVLAARSALDVKLSPDAQALARQLGRAVADKIVAYAAQQGWVSKANLPAPPEDAKPDAPAQHR